MFWAKDVDTDEIIMAEPGAVGFCPVCGSVVKAKCGDIYIWHWAHVDFDDQRRTADCDSWHEPEGPWHFFWKERVPQHMREYVLRRQCMVDGEPTEVVHRADILNSRGTVIELQHSRISVADIRARESFYIDMIWIFDATEYSFLDHQRLEDSHRYRWKNPRRYIWECRKPVFFHLGGQKLFRVKKFNHHVPCYVEGVHEDFKTIMDIYFK